MIFDSWESLARVFGLGTASYVTLILVLRISGKRTLSKMNAFDLVVTVAMGSTLATILLSRNVPLVDGIAAFVLLVLLQWLITWTSARSVRVRRWVKSDPTLLVYNGEFLRDVMLHERITEEEVLAGIRAQGVGSVTAVGAVVLETDGTLSVINADGLDAVVLRTVTNTDDVARPPSD